MKTTLMVVQIRFEHDVVHARQRARQVAALCGFESQDQVRIATAVSELARNIFQYATIGRVDFAISENSVGQDNAALVIETADQGPGIANVKEILAGKYVSKTGMGVGLIGTKKLVDDFSITSSKEKGTQVRIVKYFPKKVKPLTSTDLRKITAILAQSEPESPFEEIQIQNQELLRTLAELRQREAELGEVNGALLNANSELKETNRGVLALYAELDERAAELRKANEIKTRFLSDMSHEFRTPLNAITGLAQLLLDRVDGELGAEQEKQISYIQKAARELSEMVNDLLDLAKVEAGKIEINALEFHLVDLWGSLKGMFRPLQKNPEVQLVFCDVPEDLVLKTDERKLAQILRNLISNAMKFTERGEIKVAAETSDDGSVILSVTDTGIGIAPDDQFRVFDDFTQVQSDLQSQVNGTGLGLPLTRKLAQILGGSVTLESEFGSGSTFRVHLPRRLESNEPLIPMIAPLLTSSEMKGREHRILIIDDGEVDRYLLRGLLADRTFEIVEAVNGTEGIQLARQNRPDIIFLDFAMPDLNAIQVLHILRSSSETSEIPVIINTSKTLSVSEVLQLNQYSVAILSKESKNREESRENVRIALQRAVQKIALMARHREADL